MYKLHMICYVFAFTLCYVMLRYVMLCYVFSLIKKCYVMLCYQSKRLKLIIDKLMTSDTEYYFSNEFDNEQ